MNEVKTVYLAGPMAGYPNFNHGLFNEVADTLRKNIPGARVINPAELDESLGMPEEHFIEDIEEGVVSPLARAAYMKRDLPLVATCDAIAMLPGWQDSKGANMELLVARMVGAEIWEWEEDSRYGLVLVHAPDLMPDVFKVAAHVLEVYR